MCSFVEPFLFAAVVTPVEDQALDAFARWHVAGGLRVIALISVATLSFSRDLRWSPEIVLEIAGQHHRDLRNDPLLAEHVGSLSLALHYLLLVVLAAADGALN